MFQYKDFSSTIRREPQALLGIERKANGSEAAAWTLGQVGIRQPIVSYSPMEQVSLTAAVERDVCGGTIIGEFDIKWRRVRRKRKTREAVVARLERADVGEIIRPPDREARRISVITTIRLLRSAVIVQLLSRVVVVNILALALQLVNGVLDRPDATGGRMLSNTDRIAQTPANDVAICVLNSVTVFTEGGNVKATYLGTA
ncbi:unnamed protein product [Clonostachys rosea f. rosea IK726]|uniref:Uncharacterized protein n=1 Tax=Clonostachys rosea f. rosea IK726 TaxID=1349383 RepID=A0ACA9T6B1_BIOOC|nr:unnamed protein product [Clonostachys rosea f. rosea IK726]